MAQQRFMQLKRAICYSVTIGAFFTASHAIATEGEAVTLLTPETQTPTAVITPQISDVGSATPLLAEQDVKAKLQSWLPVGYKPLYLNQLVKLYQNNKLELLWQDQKIIEQLHQQIAEVALSGVQPQFGQWLEQLDTTELTPEARDVILSEAFLGYLSFVDQVKISGTSLLYHSAVKTLSPPSDNSLNDLLQNLQNKTLGSFVISFVPSHPYYVLMKDEIHKQLTEEGQWPEMKGMTSLKPNQSSDEVTALREILRKLKLLPELADNEQDISSIVYDVSLVDAVKSFQTAHGLDPDGIIGRQTRNWLNKTPAQRASIMALNIQRLRLTPPMGNTGIWVNIPDYSLYFYANNELILDSKVIVGRPDRKTPIMSNALNNVVVNPPWNVPTSMTRKDIVPKAKVDPSYFSRKGYTIYS